jgi:hypothetical protein
LFREAKKLSNAKEKKKLYEFLRCFASLKVSFFFFFAFCSKEDSSFFYIKSNFFVASSLLRSEVANLVVIEDNLESSIPSKGNLKLNLRFNFKQSKIS